MSNEIPWIREKLLESYPDLDQDGGVDLDGRCGIRGGEIADTNGDHFVDDSEARNFYVANREVINNNIPYFCWSSVLSPDNPIHELIYLESKLRPASEVQDAYQLLGRVLADTNRLLEEKEQEGELSPFWKMMQVYLALDQYVDFESRFSLLGSALFLGDIASGVLDCNTGTYVLLAIAYEKGWPVCSVYAPEHEFARWDDGNGNRVNFEMRDGNAFTDESYIQKFNISCTSVESGVYMSNLTPAQMRSEFIYYIGAELFERERYNEALPYIDRAIELDPRNVVAVLGRGILYWKLNRLEEAVSNLSHAIELDPQMEYAYRIRASAKLLLEDYEGALSDLDNAIAISQRMCGSYLYRHIANEALGREEAAAADLETLTDKCPDIASLHGESIGEIVGLFQRDAMGRAQEYVARGRERMAAHDLEGAIEDFTQAIELTPLNVIARSARAAVECTLSRYEECIQDFTILIESYPSYAEPYYNRAFTYFKLERYEEALRDVERALELDPTNQMAQELKRLIREAMNQ